MNTTAAINLLAVLLANAAQISAAVQRAQAEGRDLSPDEFKAIVGLDDQARAQLQTAIDAAKPA